MKRSLRHSATLAAALFAASSAQASPTRQQKIASMQYLVGTWKCEHTVGAFSGSYKTTITGVLDNLWLKQTYEFAPAQTEPAARGTPSPSVHAEALMGYDEARQAWVRFFANSEGQYFANRMTDSGEGGWAWKYISFFPRKNPETPGSDATLTRRSNSEYVIEGPTYKEGAGAMVTEHHVCKKQ